MFSYKFPANGIKLLSEDGANEIDEAIGVCSIICEMAQLNSECLQTSIEDYVKDKSEVDMDVLKVCFMYETSDGVIHDGEDLYRTSYFKRHNLKPLNLFWTAREGLVEDFFGAWYSEESDEDSYNPDDDWRIIFPFN